MCAVHNKKKREQNFPSSGRKPSIWKVQGILRLVASDHTFRIYLWWQMRRVHILQLLCTVLYLMLLLLERRRKDGERESANYVRYVYFLLITIRYATERAVELNSLHIDCGAIIIHTAKTIFGVQIHNININNENTATHIHPPSYPYRLKDLFYGLTIIVSTLLLHQQNVFVLQPAAGWVFVWFRCRSDVALFFLLCRAQINKHVSKLVRLFLFVALYPLVDAVR